MIKDFFKVVSKTFSWLSLIPSTLSIVNLITLGFDLGIAEALQRVLNAYQIIVDFVLDRLLWLTPILGYLLDRLGKWLSLNIELYPHWKHIFILMILYFGTEIKTDIARHRKKGVANVLISGTFIVFMGSVGAGTVPLAAATLSLVAVTFPLVGFISYALLTCLVTSTFYRQPGKTWLQAFGYYLLTTFLPFLIAASFAICAGTFGATWMPNPNLFVLGVFLILMTGWWLVRGIWLAFTTRELNQGRWNRFQETGSARFASIMLALTITVAIVLGASQLFL